MCGIGGFADFKSMVSKADAEKMSNTLSRRGPDEKGIYQSACVTFVHRRLAVIDPGGGKQPMTITRGADEYIMVYNGELYNTEDIRRELLKAGHRFSGHSDTEVLLSSYIEWGEDCVAHLNGIFAFAIYDKAKQKIFAARDRAGVKPFFYAFSDSMFIFGSEIKTILASGRISPEIGKEGIAEIFLIGPGRTSGKTPFKNIYELLPGECGIFSKEGFSKRKYFTLTAKEHKENLDETAEHLRFLISDAIKRQTISDVPLCSFLSGGLDSSIITAVTANTYAPETLTTYSVDYTDNDKYFTATAFQPNSDSSYIGLMSDFSKTSHKTVILNNKTLAEALCEATEARDLPCMADVDSSLLLFCRAVKKTHTVALSGECADEIFGGYPWFRNEEVLWRDDFPWSGNVPLKSEFIKDGIIDFSPGEFVRQKYFDTLKSVSYLDSDSKIDRRIRELTILNVKWFMQCLLDRKDRMSMMSGLEVRVPFCDHNVLEYAYNIPWEIKNYKSREKGIVRYAFENMLPDEIAWRKKSPYPKTHNPIYLNSVRDMLLSVVNDKNAPIWEIANIGAVKNLIDTNGNSFTVPWYGQLMNTPQIYAYLFSVNYWLKTYNIKISI